jgi:murein DD-endopeptidase MepM/ murein hydrolase activator NlpD
MTEISKRKKIITLGAAGIVVLILFALYTDETGRLTTMSRFLRPAAQAVRAPEVLYGMTVDNAEVTSREVKKDQRFADLLRGYFISPKVEQQLNLLPRKIFDFRRIAAGKKYTIISEPDSLKSLRALVYEPTPVEFVVFRFTDSLQVETCRQEVKTIEKNVVGEIKSTLSETIQELGISNDLTNRFVDIFAWQVDFQRLQRGDKFKLIYEENLVNDKPISIGRIQGIYFEQAGQVYFAIPFDQGDGTDYFNEEGKSLRKALLKYPIEFTSISSRYSLSRFHPVVKVFRPHLGTDFAAPTGTPIRSVGDGTVEEAQYKTNNGNYVKIHHNATYSTAYLHMSKIGAGIAPGVHVRQGQTIGYVGSTGLATGPHVCYRFWKNGVQVDALRVELPPSQPVKKDHLEEFSKVKENVINKLEKIPLSPTPAVMALAGN